MIRLVAAIVLLLGVLPNPYVFYMVVRVVVCAVCGYTAYRYMQSSLSG
jgi:hypothetical protein